MKTNGPAGRVTMREIARELGLSHATVSLALGDNPRIPPERRTQVKETARRMGYRPDPMLAALLHYRHGHKARPIHAALAWINTWSDPTALRRFKEFNCYWLGACETAERYGYRLEEFQLGKNVSLGRLQQVLATRNIQGILLPPAQLDGVLTPTTLDWDKFAVVCFGHSHTALPVHVVTADQSAAGRLALRKAAELGYRRVGYLTKESMLTRMLFSAGYLQAQSQLPVEGRIPMLVLSETDQERRIAQLNTWLSAFAPDAIITDLLEAPGLLKAAGVQVPGDVGLAALSVLDGNADAGINQNPVEIGRTAVETLISLINHNHRGIPKYQRHILVEGFWVDGCSMPGRTQSATGQGLHVST